MAAGNAEIRSVFDEIRVGPVRASWPGNMHESQDIGSDLVARLLQPLPGAPCGENLEYDAEFLALERMVQGKPEQQMGQAVVPGVEPAWNVVLERAVALLGRTKDLRIAMMASRALLARGFPGLCDGLALIRGLVEQHWENLFPRLDPDEGNDPTFRLNILAGLCDAALFTDRIRAFPLVISKTHGRFTLRDLASADSAPGAKGSPATSADAAFAESALEDLQATESLIRGSLDHLRALEKALAAHIGQTKAPDFSPLARLLGQAHKILTGQLARRGVNNVTTAAPAAPDSVGASPLPPLTDTVVCRDDVTRLLDRICAYYEKNEPASPLPLLLRRCQRLVSASFLDIIRDLAPAGLPQVESLRGKDA